jgi:hypothetical protein
METLSPPDVREARQKPRFRLRSPLPATFSGLPVTVTNLSAGGLRIEHPSPIKVNAAGSIRIESADNTSGVAFRGRIRWSRLSKAGGDGGKFLYTSGVQIEDLGDAAAGLLGRLIRTFGERDPGSLELKRRIIEEKMQARASAPILMPPPPPAATAIRPDQALLIGEAHTALANRPEQFQHLYERAKKSLAARKLIEHESHPIPYRREAVAIWEYLEGKIDIDLVTMVLDARR